MYFDPPYPQAGKVHVAFLYFLIQIIIHRHELIWGFFRSGRKIIIFLRKIRKFEFSRGGGGWIPPTPPRSAHDHPFTLEFDTLLPTHICFMTIEVHSLQHLVLLSG